MAFRDENGRITIDEIAAQQDINYLRSAKSDLEKALKGMQQIGSRTEAFSGNTSTAIMNASARYQAEYNKLMNMIDQTVSDIQRTVSKYEAIDRMLKETINTTNLGV